MLTDLEKRVILALQRDLEVEPRPFQELADLLGLGEEVVLAAIRSLMEKGYIRRFGATLRHQKSGFEANALVAWTVPEAELQRVGQEMAAQRVVSHCYSRRPAPAWPYNLYTMVHGRSREECLETAAAHGPGNRPQRLPGAFQRKRVEKDYHALFQWSVISGQF